MTVPEKPEGREALCERPAGGHDWEHIGEASYRCRGCGLSHVGDLFDAPRGPLAGPSLPEQAVDKARDLAIEAMVYVRTHIDSRDSALYGSRDAARDLLARLERLRNAAPAPVPAEVPRCPGCRGDGYYVRDRLDEAGLGPVGCVLPGGCSGLSPAPAPGDDKGRA